jgi:hypothetical protein
VGAAWSLATPGLVSEPRCSDCRVGAHDVIVVVVVVVVVFVVVLDPPLRRVTAAPSNRPTA